MPTTYCLVFGALATPRDPAEPLGQTVHSVSNAFTKSWCGGGYRRGALARDGQRRGARHAQRRRVPLAGALVGTAGKHDPDRGEGRGDGGFLFRARVLPRSAIIRRIISTERIGLPSQRTFKHCEGFRRLLEVPIGSNES